MRWKPGNFEKHFRSSLDVMSINRVGREEMARNRVYMFSFYSHGNVADESSGFQDAIKNSDFPLT